MTTKINTVVGALVIMCYSTEVGYNNNALVVVLDDACFDGGGYAIITGPACDISYVTMYSSHTPDKVVYE